MWQEQKYFDTPYTCLFSQSAPADKLGQKHSIDECVCVCIYIYIYIYIEEVILHLRPNGILRSPNRKKERDKTRNLFCTSIYQYDLYPLPILQQLSAALQAQADWRWKTESHTSLCASTTVIEFLLLHQFSLFWKEPKTICQYPIFTLLIFNFFYSCETVHDGSIGTEDTEYELNGQKDRGSTCWQE